MRLVTETSCPLSNKDHEVEIKANHYTVTYELYLTKIWVLFPEIIHTTPLSGTRSPQQV